MLSFSLVCCDDHSGLAARPRGHVRYRCDSLQSILSGSIRARRHSVIVGKVSVDVNVAENDGSPIFIGDSSRGNAPGALILLRRPRRERRQRWDNGERAHGQMRLAGAAWGARKGEVSCPGLAHNGRCVVVVGSVVVSWRECGKAHSHSGRCIHRQRSSDGLCFPISSANARRITAHTHLALADVCLRSTSSPSVSSVPPPFLPTTVAVGWCVKIQEGRHDGYSTLLASLATFPSLAALLRVPFAFLPHLHQVYWTLSLDSHPSRRESI